MLRGEHVRESDELVQYLTCQGQPDVVIFSNALLVGMLHDLKNQWSGPVYGLLQGDDIFTEGFALAVLPHAWGRSPLNHTEKILIKKGT